MKHWRAMNETFQKLLLYAYLQLINFQTMKDDCHIQLNFEHIKMAPTQFCKCLKNRVVVDNFHLKKHTLSKCLA